MPGTLIANIVQFTGLVVNTPVSHPHGLEVNGAAVMPKIAKSNAVGFTITYDITNITVTRTADASNGSVNVMVRYWYQPALDALTPFVVAGNAGTVPGPYGRQSFPYVATGSESAAGFDINLPAARPDTNYIATVSGGPMTVNGTVMSFNVQGKTFTKITVVPSAKPIAGDVYYVDVEQFT